MLECMQQNSKKKPVQKLVDFFSIVQMLLQIQQSYKGEWGYCCGDQINLTFHDKHINIILEIEFMDLLNFLN